MSASFQLARQMIEDEADKLVESMINDKKITRPNWWVSQRGQFGLFVVSLVVVGVVSFLYQQWLFHQVQPNQLPNSAQLATVLVAATAAFFAYYQWVDTRREASLDKFYDRLGLVNDRFFFWPEAREIVGHFWGDLTNESEFKKIMYVFLEIDNLEYIVARYQLGFVTKPLLKRAIRTFRSRCLSKEFSKIAIKLVQGSGYQTQTNIVVNVIVASIQNLNG